MDKVQVTLSPWQSKVWNDHHRYVVVNCGRRAGKTYLVAWKLFDFATKHEKATVWYVAPTYKQAKNILWEMLAEFIPTSVISKRNETELKITLKNGSTIHVKGADNPDSLRGVGIDFCVFDECAFIDKWELVWKIMRPTLIDSRSACWFVSTPNGFNHFKRMAENMDENGKSLFGDDHFYHHYTSYDNPHISKEELEETKIQMVEDAFEQEIMGEFRKMHGLIYKGFNRDIHMVDVPHIDNFFIITRTLDFGFAHKTALIYFAIAPDMSAIYAFDGLYVSGFTEKMIAEVVKQKDKGRIIVNPLADSAQPMSIAALSGYNVHFNPVEKARDSVKHGITKVAELLKVRKDTGKPTLMFSKYLTWIADEFEKYRWIQNKNDKSEVREIPYKVQDDAMDAIRYFAMGLDSTNQDFEVPDDTGWISRI